MVNSKQHHPHRRVCVPLDNALERYKLNEHLLRSNWVKTSHEAVYAQRGAEPEEVSELRAVGVPRPEMNTGAQNVSYRFFKSQIGVATFHSLTGAAACSCA